MKIAVLSDIHLDMNSAFVGEDLLPILIESLREKKVNLIIVAGDISDHVSTTIDILNTIEKELEIKVLFIPGNHDIWVKDNEKSWDSYRDFACHSSSLLGIPFELPNNYVIIGEMGWFDYSLAKEDTSIDEILTIVKEWGDQKYTDWDLDHLAMMDNMLNSVEQQLDMHRDKKVIFVTHFVPYKDFTSKSNEYMNWDVYNAFMGSEKLGELINQYDNVKYVIFGHTHERYGQVEKYDKNIICNPLGYISERNEEVFRRELEQSIIILELA